MRKINFFLILLLRDSQYLKTVIKKLNELTLKELKMIEPKLNEDVLKVFDLENSIKSKKSYGGTSFENVKKMIKKYKKESKW